MDILAGDGHHLKGKGEAAAAKGHRQRGSLLTEAGDNQLREGSKQRVVLLCGVDIAAQTVEVDGAHALAVEQTADFTGKVGRYCRHAATEYAVACGADDGNGRLLCTVDFKATQQAVNRAIFDCAVVDMFALKRLTKILKGCDVVSILERRVNGLADIGRNGSDVLVIYKTAALVVLDRGAGMGVNAYDQHVFFPNT